MSCRCLQKSSVRLAASSKKNRLKAWLQACRTAAILQRIETQSMENPEVAQIFDEVAELLEIQNANPFRVRAYRNAARTIRDLSEPIAQYESVGRRKLSDLPGIG